MPEPEVTAIADVVIPPTPPIETSSSRASFASCPPEDERERVFRADTPLPQSPEASSAIDEDGDARIANMRQEPTPEPEARLGALRDEVEEDREKRRRGGEETAVGEGDGRSAVTSPEMRGGSESEGGSARRSAEDGQVSRSEGEVDGEGAPLYMSYPPLRREKVQQ